VDRDPERNLRWSRRGSGQRQRHRDREAQ
jgi:hypothetical protein